VRELNKTTTQINLILLAAQALAIVLVWRFLPPEIPFFYSRPWGKDQLASYPSIVMLPLIGLIIFFTNLVIAQLAIKEDSLIRKMLVIASLVFSFLILISFVQIIRLIL